MATDGWGQRVHCVSMPSGHPSLSRFPGHPQKEGTKKAPHPPTRGRDRASVTLGAALCSPGGNPRVSIWGLLAHLLARIIEHQLLPARGGNSRGRPGALAGNAVAHRASPSPLGVPVSPTVELRWRWLCARRWGSAGGRNLSQLRCLPLGASGLVRRGQLSSELMTQGADL